jgi:hypothetical protein
MTTLVTLPFAQQQRLRFIESIVLWEGAVQRQRVCDVFHINPNHVTRDIQVYKKEFPKSLEYNPSVRAYEPGSRFEPRLASGDPAEYLTLLHAYAESHSVAMLPLLGGGARLVESIPTLKHAVDQHVLRGIVRAIRHAKGVDVIYNSMTSGMPVARTLWPHSLVHTGLHWHVRAFDGWRRAFRNFAIQRISALETTHTTSPVLAADDRDWHEKILVEVIPNPKLNDHQQSIVAKEYSMAMNDGQWGWSENVRKCLVGYFATHNRLDFQSNESAIRTPLKFKNLAKISPHLFRSPN